VLLKVRAEEGAIRAVCLEGTVRCSCGRVVTESGSKLDVTGQRSNGLDLRRPRSISTDCGRKYAIDSHNGG